MTLQAFKKKLSNSPIEIEFSETMAVIDELYSFTPTEFKNGNIINKENQNNGSCKLFAFAQLQRFSKEQTLACFGQFYKQDVLKNPDGDDHQNIRNFINFSWEGIEFKTNPLKEK